MHLPVCQWWPPPTFFWKKWPLGDPRCWRIVPVSKRLGSPHELSHLGDFLTMVINHQVGWSSNLQIPFLCVGLTCRQTVHTSWYKLSGLFAPSGHVVLIPGLRLEQTSVRIKKKSAGSCSLMWWLLQKREPIGFMDDVYLRIFTIRIHQMSINTP